MGRTNPTYRDVLRTYEDEWESFGRALRRLDSEAYDRLWLHANEYADAAGYLNPHDPMNAILFSMLLAHQRELDRLMEEVVDQPARVSNSQSE